MTEVHVLARICPNLEPPCCRFVALPLRDDAVSQMLSWMDATRDSETRFAAFQQALFDTPIQEVPLCPGWSRTLHHDLICDPVTASTYKAMAERVASDNVYRDRAFMAPRFTQEVSDGSRAECVRAMVSSAFTSISLRRDEATEYVYLFRPLLQLASVLLTADPQEQRTRLGAYIACLTTETQTLEADDAADILSLLENGVEITYGDTVPLRHLITPEMVQPLLHAKSRTARQRARLLLGQSLLGRESGTRSL